MRFAFPPCGAGATALLLCLPLSLAPGRTHAQILQNYLPVQVLEINSFLQQPPPDYAPRGFRVGDFVLHPLLQESLGYNSNVEGQAGGKGSPTVETSATLQGASDWSRDQLGLYVNVDNVQTPQVSALTYTNYTASVAGALDIGRDQLRAAYTFLDVNVLPNQIGGLGLNHVLPVITNDVRAGYTAQFANLAIVPTIAITTFRYSNASQSYAYLDRDLYTPGVTLRYELAPQRDVVFVLRGTSAQYPTPQDGQPGRNYTDLQMLAGLDFTASGVFRYRALIGYETRSYDSAQIASASSPIVEAAAIWTPTRLTTINGIVTHRIEDAIETNIYNYTYTDIRIAVDHQLYRNILLQAYVDAQRANYGQGGGIQTTYGVGASAAWLLNRNVRLRASIDLTDARAPSPADYTRNVALLQLQFGL